MRTARTSGPSLPSTIVGGCEVGLKLQPGQGCRAEDGNTILYIEAEAEFGIHNICLRKESTTRCESYLAEITEDLIAVELESGKHWRIQRHPASAGSTTASEGRGSGAGEEAGRSPRRSVPPAGSDAGREAFEASGPAGYTRIPLTDRGTVWGIPERFTSDSSLGAVAYMLLGSVKGCDFANEELDQSGIVYARTERLGSLSNYKAKKVCRKNSDDWARGWEGLRITHLRFFDGSGPAHVAEYVYDSADGEYVEASAGPN